MATDAEKVFQMGDVLHQGQDFEPPIGQAEQDADADVVDPRLHGPVHDGNPPVEIGLLSAQMDLRVHLAVIGLLETLIGADAGFLQGAK